MKGGIELLRQVWPKEFVVLGIEPEHRGARMLSEIAIGVDQIIGVQTSWSACEPRPPAKLMAATRPGGALAVRATAAKPPVETPMARM